MSLINWDITLVLKYGYEKLVTQKKLFEESYREVKEETPICFGDAIDVLKQGGVIRRKGWNGKD